jgi:hypothetical protein
MPEFTVDVIVDAPPVTEIDVSIDGPGAVVSVDVEFAPAPPISIDIEAATGLPGSPISMRGQETDGSARHSAV